MEKSAGAGSHPADQRAHAVERGARVEQGSLQIQTGHQLIPQWNSKYFSQIFPFVIPFMVSGPDFEFGDTEGANRWRRRDFGSKLRAPWVSADTFLAGFARRCESQCRHDWTALPVMRTVTFQYKAQTSGSLCTLPFEHRGKGPLDTSGAAYVADAQVLYDKLWHGYQRFGNLRVPIAGDTTRLQFAEGLTQRQRQMARVQRYLAEHFPGTQAVRHVMGHSHWGARVNYGDCLFFTISPNEQHSALVLKLTRYRRNDPFLKHAGPDWQRLCAVDYPKISATRRTRDSGSTGDLASKEAKNVVSDPASDDHEVLILSLIHI